MPSYRFSPQGHRLGTILISEKGGMVELTVAPKLWRSEGASACRNYEMDKLGSFSLYEKDVLTVKREDFPAVCDCLDRLSRRTREAEETEEADPTERPRTHAGLVRVETRPAKGTADELLASSEKDWALLALMLLDDRLDRRQEAAGMAELPRPEGEERAWVGSDATMSLQLLLAGWRLVHAVEQHLGKLRKNYRDEEIVTDGPRGRVLPRGFVRMASTGLPSLDCEVDSLSEVVPLTQVLVTTLELMASGGWSAMLPRFRDAALVTQTERRAALLRRYLHAIPCVSRELAVRLCDTLRLSSMQRVFAPVLRDCRVLLTHTPPAPAEGDRTDAPDFVMWFDTARLWEMLLLRGLWEGERAARRGSDVPKDEKENWRPWLGLSQKVPDLIVDDRRIVVDAKYRDCPRSPSSAEQYQMFAYSHIVGDVKRAVLAYPANGACNARSWRRHDENVTLTAAELPFPSKEECLSDEAWRGYEARLAARWKEVLDAK